MLLPIPRFEVQVDLLPQVNWPKEKSYLGMEIAIKMDLADPSEEADKEFRSLLREKGILRVKQGDGLEVIGKTVEMGILLRGKQMETFKKKTIKVTELSKENFSLYLWFIQGLQVHSLFFRV